MATITRKQLEDYQRLCRERNNGRISTPDDLLRIYKIYKMTRKPSESIY